MKHENIVNIIVATHKKYKMPEDFMYLPLQVGAFGKESIGFQRDDDGENISELNPYFCELTGLFWAWKNLNSDFIGLVHYRRHFGSKKMNDPWPGILKYDDIKNLLASIKVFVPRKRRYYIETLYSHYKHTHYHEQLDTTREIIIEKFPEYLDSYDLSVKQRWGYMFNMMIMEKNLFNEYCFWLFDILFELRNKLGEEGLSPYQARYYGRVSEILFNVWINYNLSKKKLFSNEIQELPIVFMEKVNWWKKGTAFLKAKFLSKKYEGSF